MRSRRGILQAGDWRAPLRDLLAALLLLLLATSVGMVGRWPLMVAAWRGELAEATAAARLARRLQEFQGIQVVTLAEAYALWQSGRVLVIDARPAPDYQELHIPGAINLPPEVWPRLTELPLLQTLPRQQPFLIYCSQEACDDALKLGRKLQALGFTGIMAFTGGFRAWDAAGYPVDTSL